MKRLFLQLLVLTAALTVNAQNPYLPLWEHLPDGEPRVFEDPDHPGKYRAYIIGSHDVTYTAYCGPDIRMWSAPVEDRSQGRDEGPIFTGFVNGQWDGTPCLPLTLLRLSTRLRVRRLIGYIPTAEAGAACPWYVRATVPMAPSRQ